MKSFALLLYGFHTAGSNCTSLNVVIYQLGVIRGWASATMERADVLLVGICLPS